MRIKGCSRQSLMKLAPVNSEKNVCELVFVQEMDVLSNCIKLRTIYQVYVDRRGISYEHYCHFLTMVKSSVA